MPEPTFIIPGASRSGTTTLWSIVREHPDVCTAEEKEIRFFDKDSIYKKGKSFYEEKFAKCNGSKEIGEASPTYLNKGIIFDEQGKYKYDKKNDAPLRIKKMYPNIKLIFTFRNPIDRMFSQFWKNVRQGRESRRSVMKAVKEEIEGDRTPPKHELCWIYRNSYATHFRNWKSLFDDDQIKVMIFEEWTNNMSTSVKEVYEFIGVDKEVNIERGDRRNNVSRVPRSDTLCRLRNEYFGESLLGKAIRWLNQRQGRPKPTESERKWLFEILKDEVYEMEEMLNRSLSIWYPKNSA
jgi:hypothetical protein